ncbi:tail fiber protein [bacterium]|nr:tail fiber protein [bacterium]
MIKQILNKPLFQLALLMMFLPLCLSVMEKTWKIYGVDAYFNNESFVFDNGSGFIETEIQETGCADSATKTWMLKAIQNLKLVDGTDLADISGSSATYLTEVWTGAIMPFAGPVGPGWLICDGSEYPVGPNTNCKYRTLFSKLANGADFDAGGGTPLWGTSGTTGSSYADYEGTLKVPDLRGYFLRGSDATSLVSNTAVGRDSSYTQRHLSPDFSANDSLGEKQKTTNLATGDVILNSNSFPVGTYQGYTYGSHSEHELEIPTMPLGNSDAIHNHTYNLTNSNKTGPVGSWSNVWEDDNYVYNRGNITTLNTPLTYISGGTSTLGVSTTHTHTITPDLSVTNNVELETRPKNASVYFYIKY